MLKQPSTIGFGDAMKTPASTALAAGEMTTLQFSMRLSPTFTCYVNWSFVPVADKHYLIAGTGSPPTNCQMRLLDATDADDIKPELTALRRDSQQTNCIPLAQSPAAGAAAVQAGQGGTGDAVLNPNATDQDLCGLVGQ